MEKVLHDVELVCSSMLLACLFVFLLHCLWGADGVFLMKFFRVRQDRAENLKLCQLFFFFFNFPCCLLPLLILACASSLAPDEAKGWGGGGKSFFNFWVCSVWEREGDRMPPMEPPNPDSGCNYELLPGTAWWTSRCTLKDNPNDCLTSRGTICVWSCIHAFFTFWFCPFRVFFVCVNLSLITWETGKSC